MDWTALPTPAVDNVIQFLEIQEQKQINKYYRRKAIHDNASALRLSVSQKTLQSMDTVFASPGFKRLKYLTICAPTLNVTQNGTPSVYHPR